MNRNPETENNSLHPFFIPSEEIRIYSDKNGYWLVAKQCLASEWTSGIKSLKKGENTFAGDFPNGHYLLKAKIDEQNLTVSFYKNNWTELINAENFKLFRHKSFAENEKGAIITPQVFAYLEDFGLLKTKK